MELHSNIQMMLIWCSKFKHGMLNCIMIAKWWYFDVHVLNRSCLETSKWCDLTHIIELFRDKMHCNIKMILFWCSWFTQIDESYILTSDWFQSDVFYKLNDLILTSECHFEVNSVYDCCLGSHYCVLHTSNTSLSIRQRWTHHIIVFCILSIRHFQ